MNCTVGGCGRPVKAKGMCYAHYGRAKRGLSGERLTAPVGGLSSAGIRGGVKYGRNAAIVTRHAAGETMQAIGDSYGISRQRVEQIVNKAAADARNKLAAAMDRGMVRRAVSCALCGSPDDLSAHHHDYSRPLDVQWLCRSCHAACDQARRRMEAETQTGISPLYTHVEIASRCGVNPSAAGNRAKRACVNPIIVVANTAFYTAEQVAEIERVTARGKDISIPARCERNHFLFPENTRINANGTWECLECASIRMAEYTGRKKLDLSPYDVRLALRAIGTIRATNAHRIEAVTPAGVRIRFTRSYGATAWKVTAAVEGWSKPFGYAGSTLDLARTIRDVLADAEQIQRRAA